jgi:hypothetical protein
MHLLYTVYMHICGLTKRPSSVFVMHMSCVDGHFAMLRACSVRFAMLCSLACSVHLQYGMLCSLAIWHALFTCNMACSVHCVLFAGKQVLVFLRTPWSCMQCCSCRPCMNIWLYWFLWFWQKRQRVEVARAGKQHSCYSLSRVRCQLRWLLDRNWVLFLVAQLGPRDLGVQFASHFFCFCWGASNLCHVTRFPTYVILLIPESVFFEIRF